MLEIQKKVIGLVYNKLIDVKTSKINSELINLMNSFRIEPSVQSNILTKISPIIGEEFEKVYESREWLKTILTDL